MSTLKSYLLLIVTSFVTWVLMNGHLVDGQRQFRRESRAERYCGKRIAEMLEVVCAAKSFPYKRASQKIEDEYQLLNEDGDQRPESSELDYPGLFGRLSSNEFPIISKSKALAVVRDENFRRRRRGIVEECCMASCSRSELATYCDNVS